MPTIHIVIHLLLRRSPGRWWCGRWCRHSGLGRTFERGYRGLRERAVYRTRVRMWRIGWRKLRVDRMDTGGHVISETVMLNVLSHVELNGGITREAVTPRQRRLYRPVS